MPAEAKAFDIAGKRIWIAGHSGLVGQALQRRLGGSGCTVLTVGRERLDLRRQAEVEGWLEAERPDAVILCAATVGGIEANRTRPADFLYDNLAIALNVMDAAAKTGVAKLLCLGSSCFYPRLAENPIREDTLLSGSLEPTNEWYAIAKIATVKLAQAYRRQYGLDFIAAVPTNLYGPGDNFDSQQSHVVPALIRKLHEAKESGREATLWGSGAPRRELLYVDDAADALIFLLQRYSDEMPVNIAGGEEVSIAELAARIAAVVGYTGAIRFDASRPDGMPRKVLDGGRIAALGWKPQCDLGVGLRETYSWFREAHSAGRIRAAV